MIDERQISDTFHEALDVQPPPGAFSRLEAALARSKVRPAPRFATVQLWPRAHLGMAAAVVVVFLIAAAVGVFAVANRPSSQAVPVVAPPRGTIVFARALSANGDENLFTIHADGTGERPLLATTGACCGGLKWSHKGDRVQLQISAPPPNQDLPMTATVKADGSDYRVLQPGVSGLFFGPGAWSPDDSRIALEGLDPRDPSRNGIYTTDAADGANPLRVTRTTTEDIPIAYSPDGSKILFWRLLPNNSEDGQLLVVGVDGSHLVQMSPPGMTSWVKVGDPGGWSPDGTQISFAAFSFTTYNPGLSAVFVAAGDGTNARQISAWGTFTTSARWSPAGDWIVFDKEEIGFDHRFFLIHPDGSGITQISSVTGVCCAVWSPDGNRLLFIRGPNDRADLWTVQLDGSHLTRLSHAPASLSLADLAWTASN